MKEKIPIEAAKERRLCRTNILDRFFNGWILELQSIFKESKLEATYIIQSENKTFLFKSLVCPLTETQIIVQARNEYQLALQCTNLTPSVQQLIDHKEEIDQESGKQYIELLYEHFENNLNSVIGKLDEKEAVSIMRKILRTLAILEANGIFHSDLKPENIAVEGKNIKILNCASSLSFGQKMELMKLGKAAKSELLYYPPEAIRSEEYVVNKIDVYSWGMIFYQMMTMKNKEDLEKEIELRLTDHNKFLGNLDKIEFKSDTLKEDILRLLLKVLNLNNKSRPTFREALDYILNRDYYKQKYLGTRELLGKAESERSTYKFISIR